MSNNQQENQEEKTVHQIWRELGISYANYQFSCGGDSMNETTLTLTGKDGEEISNQEIEDYIEDEIYNRVEFYVNSDGHYMGESGDVKITLEDGEDDFCYSKSSQSEWNENIQSEIRIGLDEKEVEFIKAKVLNINGSSDEFVWNYKEDLILTDEEEELQKELETKMEDRMSEFQPETDNEVQDWYTFTTNGEGKDITFDGNELIATITNQVYEYRDE
jgi:hypothetical protein